MPNMNVNFGGQALVIPGVYPQINTSAVLPTTGTRPTTLLVIAASDGGAPNTPYYFSSASDLKAFMRGAPAASYIPFMASPSPGLSPSSFAYINPCSNTVATAVLKGGSGGINPEITLTSAFGGLSWNNIRYQVSAGTIANSSNITIQDHVTGTTFSGSNLGVPLQVTYNGSSSGASFGVTPGSPGSFGVAADDGSATVYFNVATTIGQLATIINSSGTNFVVSVLGDPNLPTSQLDSTTGSISISPGATVPVTAILGSVVFWVNTVANSLVTASLVSGHDSGTGAVLTPTSGNKFLLGGATVAPVLTGYQAALTASLNVSCWAMFCDASDSATQAICAKTADLASTLQSKGWRRYVTGSTLGETATNIQTAARSLNSKNSTFCAPGITQASSISGVPTTYPGMYLAAAVAGAMCAVPAATPLTNLPISAVGVETQYTTAQIDGLQQAGVMVCAINPITKVPTIVSDFTTWQSDNNPENVWNQQIACQDALLYGFVNVLQPYVGGVATPTTLAKAKNSCKLYLNNSVYSDTTTEGVLASWDSSSLVLSYNGYTQTMTATVSVMFVGQFRFITVTVNAQPLNLTIQG